MTPALRHRLETRIIPYQELLGNYDCGRGRGRRGRIIPYQELLGNYYFQRPVFPLYLIIPYQELLGNYDASWQTLTAP